MKSNMQKHMMRPYALGMLTLAMTTPALASDPAGWYIGASVGESQANIAEDEVIADLLQSGLTTTDFTEDDSDIGFKLLAGYQFNPYFAVEGGYFDLGEFSYSATTNPAGVKDGQLGFQGWNLDLLGMVPVFERSALFARIGAQRGESDVSFADGGAVTTLDPSPSETGTDYKFGVGFQYGITDALALRLEAERYRMDDAVGNSGDLDLISAGFIYKFTRKPHDTAQTVRQPVEEAPMSPVSSELVVVPLPVASEKYCALLDIQFEIVQHEIEQKAWEKLAVVATFLKRYPKTSAVIKGYSDSVGTTAANQELSQERAQSVVDYLVKEHQVSRSRLTAVSYGETRPLQSNATEEGKRANRRIGAVIGCATDIAGLDPLPARMTLAMHIEFDTDAVSVAPEYHDELRKVAGFMKANPTIKATVEGHADNASPATAQTISRQRAQSVASYLESKFGIEASRLTVEGFGATRRYAYNTSAEGRQENRRVNIILDYQD